MSEAKAILRGDGRYVEFCEEDYREDRDRWLDVCQLYSSRIEYESPSSAWIDLSRHPDPCDIATRLLSGLWHLGGWPIAAALAPAKWIAKTAAVRCDPAALSLGLSDFAVVDEPSVFLRQLPTYQLSPVAYEHRKRLDFLGYRRIGDVQEAPLHLLQRQFGRDGILIQQAALGKLDDPVRPNYPRLAIESYRAFDGACEDRHAIRGAMDEIARDLTSQLQTIDMLAGATESVFELESGHMLRRVRKLPKPSDSLALSLHFQLETTKIEQPLTSLRVVVPDLRKASVRQRSLDGRSHEDLLRNATASVRELQAMYGDKAVQSAKEIEQPRRSKLLKAWRDATGWH